MNCHQKCGNITLNGNITGYVSQRSSAAESATVNKGNSSELDLCITADRNENGSLLENDQNKLCNVVCRPDNGTIADCYYGTVSFWSFVLLMCLGTIAFNVANCVSDAVCFDMLGDKTMKYGGQRVWGTIGFGLTALIGGIAVNYFIIDSGDVIQNIAPALCIMVVFGACDIVSIKWLRLPKFGSTEDEESITKKVWSLLKQKHIVIFLIFATLAGILDSFIIFYMFWFLEDVAERTGYMASIKLIEGFIVAAECLGGEILFFLISGKILKRIGYVHCLTFCFFMYSIRLGLISMITNPWYLILIELFMQGPTYALCYTCIVAYASAVSPPGTTGTVQGLVAGMDDGVGKFVFWRCFTRFIQSFASHSQALLWAR